MTRSVLASTILSDTVLCDRRVMYLPTVRLYLAPPLHLNEVDTNLLGKYSYSGSDVCLSPCQDDETTPKFAVSTLVPSLQGVLPQYRTSTFPLSLAEPI
jgi:hypothetical protein